MALSPGTAATLILLVHFAIVAFNVFGLVAIPFGKWLRWEFVRGFWWRFFHVLSLAVVALQAVLGRACFLVVHDASSTSQHAATWLPAATLLPPTKMAV